MTTCFVKEPEKYDSRMKRFVILFSTGCTGDEIVKVLLGYLPVKDESKSVNSPLLPAVSQTFYNVVNTVHRDSENRNIAKDEDAWTELCDESLEKFSLSPELDECLSTDDLAERLHILADRLPRIGAFIDVVWYIDERNNNDIQIEENLELYGALKRLVEWNEALVSLVTEGVTDMTVLRQWADMLGAEVKSASDVRSSRLLWRGCINVTSADNVLPSINLRGFELRASDDESQETPQMDGQPGQLVDVESQILSGQMEFMAEVDLAEIPGFYITHTAYRLHLSTRSPMMEKSAKFLDRLKQHKQLCYLACLPYHTTEDDSNVKVTTRHREKEERTSWKDFVLHNSADLTSNYLSGIMQIGSFATTESFRGNRDHFMLLCAARTPLEEGTILAFLLHPLERIHGNALHDVTMTQLSRGVSQETRCGTNVVDLIKVLPHVNAHVLLQMEANINRLQTESVLAWKDENIDKAPSAEDLTSLVTYAKAQYLQQLDESGWFGLDRALPSDTLRVTKQCVAEYGLDPSDQLERRVLLLESSLTNQRRGRHKTADHLEGLSPPHGSQVVALDVAQFLKCFRSDGTAFSDELSPLLTKQSGDPRWSHRPSREQLETSVWPECASIKYHGIHYNQASSSDGIECSRSLTRLRKVETASTCTVDQTHSPATMTVPGSETQRSHKKRRPEKQEEKAVRKRGQKRGAEEAFTESGISSAAKDGLKTSERLDKAREKKNQRSIRHQQKLERVVKAALLARGVAEDGDIFESCSKRLYTITKSYVKDLKTSINLKQEMEKIANDHIMQVINFERNRRSTEN